MTLLDFGVDFQVGTSLASVSSTVSGADPEVAFPGVGALILTGYAPTVTGTVVVAAAAAPVWSLYLNETDLTTIGCYPEDTGNWRNAPTRDYPILAIPGRQGVVFAADPVVGVREIRVKVMIHPSPLTVAARVAAEDRLKALSYRALVQIIDSNGSTSARAIDGVCRSCSITPRRHPTVALVSDAELSIVCPDPTWRDVLGQTVAFNATPTAVPLGTAPSGGIIRVSAPPWSADVVNPVLTYYNAAQVSVQSMTFGVTLTAGTDYLEVDLDRSIITKYVSGVGSDFVNLTDGDFFTIDPMDGDVLDGSYPLMGLTATAGTPSGQWLGVRRWL